MSVQKFIASLCYVVCVLPTLSKTYLIWFDELIFSGNIRVILFFLSWKQENLPSLEIGTGLSIYSEKLVILTCKSNKCTFLSTFHNIREKIGS